MQKKQFMLIMHIALIVFASKFNLKINWNVYSTESTSFNAHEPDLVLIVFGLVYMLIIP